MSTLEWDQNPDAVMVTFASHFENARRAIFDRVQGGYIYTDGELKKVMSNNGVGRNNEPENTPRSPLGGDNINKGEPTQDWQNKSYPAPDAAQQMQSSLSDSDDEERLGS